MSEQIDTVVRFHDDRRIAELKRCVFSLVGQTYRPIRIILVLQRFQPHQVDAVEQALGPLLEGRDAPQLAIVNLTDPEPADARSVLLNLGVQNATGKYLAFLDYDDVLYPEAYEMMIGRLKETGAAIAFAKVRVMRVDVYDAFFYTKERVTPPFSGSDLLDLFHNNFCPLHSYVIDRSQVPTEMLNFVTTLTMEEDYDVLLRVCAAFLSDFALISTEIGDYYYKTDGSNTVPVSGGLTGEARVKFLRDVKTAIETRRRGTIVAPAVQKSLGLRDAQPRTIRQVLDRLPAR
ncbi:MAG: glycosyltransferase family A protein [Rhodospirillaceae bacterium]